jgi:hypothetical protein
LPAPLDRLIGEPTVASVSIDALKRYMATHQIQDTDVGGTLTDPVSRTSDGLPAAYFIIHDTSDPSYKRTESFPPTGMDMANWEGNRLDRYLKPSDCPAKKKNRQTVCQPVAHVFINRLGQSATGHNFGQGWRSTQYEGQTTKRRGLFLAVENVQPRRKDKNGIDFEAPNPGFTDAQLDRLALVYVAASVRRGEWLIPAFHGVIDLKAGTHDDPQHFNLQHWADHLQQLISSIR